MDIEAGEYPLLPAIARMLEQQHTVLILSTHVSHIHAIFARPMATHNAWDRLPRDRVARPVSPVVAPPPNRVLVHRSGRRMDGGKQDGRGDCAGAPAEAGQRRDDPLGASVAIVR